MKGVILAGGSGSRLHPLTVAVNKHLLPIGRQPMVMRSLIKLVESGVEEVCIVTNPEYVSNFSSLLKSGKDYGCDISYKVQDQPGGIAQALGLCKKFVGNNNCTVLLGDNMFSDSLKEDIKTFSGDCKLFFKHVPDGHRYGVGNFAKDGTLTDIEEKPSGIMDAYACVGIYIYNNRVFDFIEQTKPSERGELEITTVNNMFIKDSEKVSYRHLNGWWTDAGTLESFELANKYAYGE